MYQWLRYTGATLDALADHSDVFSGLNSCVRTRFRAADGIPGIEENPHVDDQGDIDTNPR